MSFDVEGLRTMIARHGKVVRIVVAEIQGSTPREVGAALCAWPGGQSGTIGGGALEHDAIARGLSIGADRIDRIALGPALGQCCGGAVTLLSEVWDAERLLRIDGGPLLARGPGEMPLAVRRVLAKARGGSPVEPALIGGWMIEPLAPAARPLWIFGAGHVGRALVSVLSPLPDFAITWVDTSSARFPELPDNVTQLIAANPADAVEYAPTHAEHLILTYSHAIDLELCHRLLLHGFAGAGLIGSKTKWARFRKRLAQLGHSTAQISRICCPIGQPALGKHPQAIAVGVTASLLSQGTAIIAARDTA